MCAEKKNQTTYKFELSNLEHYVRKLICSELRSRGRPFDFFNLSNLLSCTEYTISLNANSVSLNANTVSLNANTISLIANNLGISFLLALFHLEVKLESQEARVYIFQYFFEFCNLTITFNTLIFVLICK